MFLDELARTVATVERKRHEKDRHPTETRAICELLLAWGYRQIGNAARAAELRASGMGALPTTDAVFRVARAMFEQRLDGAPLDLGALPVVVKFDVYKIDRLRQASRILDPGFGGDPIGAFHVQSTVYGPSGAPIVDAPLTADEAGQLAAYRLQPGDRMPDLLRLLRRASTTMSADELIAWLPFWSQVTDRFSMAETHFCISAVSFVDILVSAAVRA